MLQNENIICISSIDWNFIWQGHQEIMSTLARNGNRVLFIENTGVRVPGIRDFSRVRDRIRNWLKGVKGIRKEADNLYIYSPLVLPFPYSRIARWINRHLMLPVIERWMKTMDFSDPVVWTFLPTPLSIDITEEITKKLSIYYCIDNFSVSSIYAKKITKSEERLLKKVDLVFVTSKELYTYCSRYNDNVYNFPFAVNFKEFEKIRLGDYKVPDEIRRIARPVIGYVGGLHKWVDQDLIKEILARYPQCSFVFVGPIQADISKISNLKNAYFLGKKEHDEIPLFIKYFDACIIPYILTAYTDNVYPTKLNEYLAMGKPVISTFLPEVEAFNKLYESIIYVAGDDKSFIESITGAIGEDNQALKDRRIEAARRNSWERRIEDMSALIDIEIEKRKKDKESNWKENLLNFYMRARRRMLRFTAAFVFVYLLLFRTPFIWFLASPLKVFDVPQKSEVILVFGGGVGETGSPGKSTIERARYAAELYRQGYADKIIFSSGYTYRYNDAENMKLFAVSMGVQEKDIILEEKANSTYENVKFSKEILYHNGWNRVLLISSPYNMKRTELVFNKSANDVKVLYVPVKNSQFYDRSAGVRLEQIKAIMHEYFGITYYLIKGYI